MKAKFALALILVAVVALVSSACYYKTTGGGFVTDEDGNKTTFGFTAIPTEDFLGAKGKFQMVEHDTKTKIHGTFEYVDVSPPWQQGFWGECYVNGDGPYPFMATAEDNGEPGVGAGDEVWIVVFNPGGPSVYGGVLEGGNIQVHDEED